MKKNQNGSFLIYAIVIVVVLVVAGVVIYMLTANKDNKGVQNDSALTNVESVSEPSLYIDKQGGFSVELPTGWTTEQPVEDFSNGELSSRQYSFVKNDVMLTLIGDVGGKGGFCDPNSADKPHGSDNACPTLEYLSAEKIPVSGETKKKIGENDLWYYRSKYTYFGSSSADDQEEQYGFCLETRSPEEEDPKLNDPVMGFYLGPCYEVSAANAEFLYYHFEVKGLDTGSVEVFNQSVVPEIEQIIKSFKFI